MADKFEMHVVTMRANHIVHREDGQDSRGHGSPSIYLSFQS
jgi:hypothetical protein